MSQEHNNNTAQNIVPENLSGDLYHHVIGDAGVLTLNRPKVLNALNYSMVLSIQEILARWKDDPAIGHVVISSSNSRAFCAGGDVRKVRESILGGNFREAELFFRGEYLADLAIAKFGKPVIALCDGLVMGGGAGLAQHSSHIVMTETTKFAMPETRIGLFPDVGASLFFGRCPIPVARLLGMTGHIIDGASCIVLGLASAIVPSQNINFLKQDLTKCKTSEIDRVIESYQIDPGVPTLNQYMNSIDDIFSGDINPEDMQDRAKSLLLLRPKDPFVKQVVKAFAYGCPSSIKVFWRLLEVAEGFSSADAAISFDYHLALRMIGRPDFAEGIRALLVDKDKAPKWAPNRLELVDNGLLAEVFDHDGLPPLL